MKGTSEETSFDELSELNHVPLNDALDALAHSQRRELLFSLLDHNPQTASPVPDANSEVEITTQIVKMHHVHLPKLADYGFIDWDQETHEVTKGPNFGKIDPLLKLLADHEDDLPEIWA